MVRAIHCHILLWVLFLPILAFSQVIVKRKHATLQTYFGTTTVLNGSIHSIIYHPDTALRVSGSPSRFAKPILAWGDSSSPLFSHLTLQRTGRDVFDHIGWHNGRLYQVGGTFSSLARPQGCYFSYLSQGNGLDFYYSIPNTLNYQIIHTLRTTAGNFIYAGSVLSSDISGGLRTDPFLLCTNDVGLEQWRYTDINQSGPESSYARVCELADGELACLTGKLGYFFLDYFESTGSLFRRDTLTALQPSNYQNPLCGYLPNHC